MNPTSETPQNTVTLPHPDLNRLSRALGSPVRWRMLTELSHGEARSVGELATAGGCHYDNAGRHLAVLRQAGLVEQGRGRLYSIPRQYLPATGASVVDFGHCLLRRDVAA